MGVRLGHRTIQKMSGAPILLTGYQALNKLMGRPVYTSNQQLGGPEIMYSNGVSHMTVSNDIEGVAAMLRWLSFVPAARGLPCIPLPIVDDPVDRDIDVIFGASPDPRAALCGVKDPAGEWLSGFFDRGS